MNPKAPLPTSAWLTTSNLRNLLHRVEIHKRLLREIRSALPAHLAGHCQDCAVSDGHLIVYTDGQNWSFQLRFHASDLLARLKAVRGESFRSLRTRCLPHERANRPARGPVARPKPETATLIERFGRDAASDELGKALLRLAATLRDFPGDGEA